MIIKMVRILFVILIASGNKGREEEGEEDFLLCFLKL
jgi:hypothetical protein